MGSDVVPLGLLMFQKTGDLYIKPEMTRFFHAAANYEGTAGLEKP